MSPEPVQDLLEFLSSLDKGTSLEDVAALLQQRAQPPSFIVVKRRCALVRSFDLELYQFLCAGLDSPPAFEDFVGRIDPLPSGSPREIDAGEKEGASSDNRSDQAQERESRNLVSTSSGSTDLERVGMARWRLKEGARAHCLREWQQPQQQGEWTQWHRKLADYFLARSGPDAQLNALYHLAVGDQVKGLALFHQWYNAADEQFDMAQCNALLEVLRSQERWRGPDLSSAWRENRQYYDARMFFLADYYRTASYLNREVLLNEFRKVFQGGGPWIFHLHANGGLGKTIFLRWLAARYLVPKRIPCARIDFDDFRLADLVNSPTRLLTRIVEQLDQQLPPDRLTSLLERLKREQASPGWNTDVLAEIQRQFQGASLTGPVVIMLDTLEEATLSQAEWLKQSIERIQSLRAAIPRLCLVLSGRYDVPKRVSGFDADQWHVFEIPPFTKLESDRYLVQRGMDRKYLRKAVLRKAGGEPFKGANPFKLALFTELILNRKGLTASYVENLPRVDLAYLIERVVMRIESQPLRWVIRYGAIPRNLTQDFLDEVLLPHLRRALQGGQSEDNPTEHLPEGIAQDVWQPDPAALQGLSAAHLWQSLKGYARDRGWISLMDGSPNAVHFHPEVVDSTRELLRYQKVFAPLQKDAIAFFEHLCCKADNSESWTEAAVETIFHRFQLDGPAAAPAWEDIVCTARTKGSAAALAVIKEILKKEYSEAERIPRSRGEPHQLIVSAQTLVRAHCLAAELLLESAGVCFFAEAQEVQEFRRHVELAQLIEKDAGQELVPRFLHVVYRSLTADSLENATRFLEEQTRLSWTPREQFFLELHLAEHLARSRSRSASAHYRRAISLQSQAGPLFIPPTEPYLRLADWYEFQGEFAAMLETCRQAFQAAPDSQTAAKILARQAAYALDANDLATARARLQSARSYARADAFELLEARLALAAGDPLETLRRCDACVKAGSKPLERAQASDLCGEAYSRLYEFTKAMEFFDRASKGYDDAGVVAGSARCAVLQIRLLAALAGNYVEAESLLGSAQSLRGMKDAQIFAELESLRAFIFRKTGRVKEAKTVLRSLLLPRDPPWPPRILARIRCWCLVGEIESAGDTIEELYELLAAIHPASARYEVINPLEHREGKVPIDHAAFSRLLSLFPTVTVAAPAAVPNAIARAHLHRVFGDTKQAQAELHRARVALDSRLDSVPALLASWSLSLAAEEMEGETNFTALAGFLVGSPLRTSPLAAAANLKAGLEKLRSRSFRAAEGFIKSAQDQISAESQLNAWRARAEEAVALLAEATGRNTEAAVHRRAAAGIYLGLGDRPAAERIDRAAPGSPAPAATPEAPHSDSIQLVLDEQTVGEPARSLAFAGPEAMIDQMLGSWSSLAKDLGESLARTNAGLERASVIELRISPGPLSALPWEAVPLLAACNNLLRRSYGGQRETRPPGRLSPRESKGAVRIVRPKRGEEFRGSANYEHTSGMELETLYQIEAEVEPAVSYSTSPEQLGAELQKMPPVVLHFVAAIRESSGGDFLDFESTEERAYSNGDQDRSLLTVSRLDRLLASLPQAPFVILDITHPQNDAEAVRMLLLRNVFAEILLQLGHTTGVLAIGLAEPAIRSSATRPWIAELGLGSSMRDIVRVARRTFEKTPVPGMRPSPFRPALAAALFAEDPTRSPLSHLERSA